MLAKYKLPWDVARHGRPKILRSTYGRLFAGMDFYLEDERRLVFYQDPILLWPDGRILGDSSTIPTPTLHHKILGLPPGDYPTDPVVTFFREKTTPQQLKKALAALIGRKAFDQDTVITEVVELPTGYLYRADGIEIPARYPHTPLKPNILYPEGFVIGGGVEVISGYEGFKAWWGYADTSKPGGKTHLGDRIYPHALLNTESPSVLENSVIPAYAIFSDVPGDAATTHIRFQVCPDRGADDAYWAGVWARETRTGKYLNSILNLPAPPPARTYFTGAPACWDEVLTLHLHATRAAAVWGERIDPPSLKELPSNLITQVNPVEVFMKTGWSDILTYVRVDVPVSTEIARRLSGFLSKARFTDRVVLYVQQSPPVDVGEVFMGSLSSVSFGPSAAAGAHLEVTDEMDIATHTHLLFH